MERGVDRIAAEELTVPPGGDELFSLLVLKGHVESGEWDVIIVDCAPTGETLRLLSFPDAARWWLDKVLGQGAVDALGRAPARAHVPRRPAARREGDRRDPAARRQPRGHARAAARRLAGDDAAGDDARPDGRRRGDAHVHLPEPLRVPDRRRGREPRLPRRALRGLLRRLARRPAGAARAGRQRVRRAGPEGAVLRVGGDRRRAAGRARGRDLRRTAIPPPSCTTGSRRSSR